MNDNKKLIDKIHREDILAITLLAAFAVFSRLPFTSKIMFHSDSIRYAMGMDRYDVSQMQPHAPGYFLYVYLGKIFNLVTGDAGNSLLIMSIIFTGLMAIFLYFLGKQMFGFMTGALSALLLLCSPLVWYNGEIHFPYILEGFFSACIAFVCYQIVMGRNKWIPLSALLMGLAGGIRQTTPILLFPLWIYALWRVPMKQIVLGLFIFVITCLSWFLPMVILTGGLAQYYKAVDAQFNTFVLHPYPYLEEIKGRAGVFKHFMKYSLTWGILPIIYYLGRFFKLPDIIKEKKLQYLLFWIIPPILFFVGVNVFNPGHVIILLPPLFIVLAEACGGVAKDMAEAVETLHLNTRFPRLKGLVKGLSPKRLTVLLTFMLVVFNAYIFLGSHTEVSYATIREESNRLKSLIDLTRANFVPNESAIITVTYNTQLSYYLPEYRIYCPMPILFSPSDIPISKQNVYISFGGETTPKSYWIPTEFAITPIDIPPGVRRIIFWGDELAQYYDNSERPLKKILSSTKNMLYYVDANSNNKIYYNHHYIDIK